LHGWRQLEAYVISSSSSSVDNHLFRLKLYLLCSYSAKRPVFHKFFCLLFTRTQLTLSVCAAPIVKVGAIHSGIACKFGCQQLNIHVWDFRAQRCSPTRYTAPSWSADMSSSVSLFMTRIFASIGFASGPSRACQVSLVTTPLSGRLAVAYTWVHLLKLPWLATAETRALQMYAMQLQDTHSTSAIDCT